MLTHFIVIKLTAWHIPEALIQKSIPVTGVIDSIPEKKFHGERFIFQTTTINHKKISTKLMLAWYTHAPALSVGQSWQLAVKLKPLIGTHNPGGFDYAAFLASMHISATGNIDSRSSNTLLNNNSLYLITHFREKIQHAIQMAIHNPTLAAFISALCVGLRDGLTENDWAIFQKTGTNHLVAIAGLHIGFVAGAFYFLMNKAWRLSEKLLLFFPAKRAAEIASLFGALCYTALSGFAIPAERASIMLFCFLVGNMCNRPMSLWRRWCFAAIIILIINLDSITDASFWLSFSSIAIIAWAMQGRLKNGPHIQSVAKMQLAIIVGLLPLMLLFFQQASLIAFFTNAVAIPWVGFVILPVTLLACFLDLLHASVLSHALFCMSGKLLSPLWSFLTFSAGLPFSSIHAVIFHQWILFFALLGFIFLLAPLKFPMRYMGCFGLLPLFFYYPLTPLKNNYWLSVIDVGQGLSVFVQTKNHVLLYDTGAHFPGGFDFGESVVTPYLRLQNIHTIDRLEISHGDNDHSGGADAILKNFSVHDIFTSAPTVLLHLHALPCYAGQTWVWDGVRFSTLHPLENSTYADNNSSCVIKIDNGAASVLLTGDIERATENQLVEKYGNGLRSTVLIAPHHGSRTSSSEAFLQKVSPRVVIISAGKLNRYRLPAQSVLDRYKMHHFRVLNTADHGAVILKSDAILDS